MTEKEKQNQSAVAVKQRILNTYQRKADPALPNKSVQGAYTKALWNGYNWKADVSDDAKKAFMEASERKYKLVLFGDKRLYPVDKNGNRIPDPTQSGKFLLASELFVNDGINSGLYDVSKLNSPTVQPAPKNEAGVRQRLINKSTRNL